MDAIKIFENSNFGKIRTATDANGNPLFCLVDLLKVLDLGNTTAVKSRLYDDEVYKIGQKSKTKTFAGTHEKTRHLLFVSEANFYNCIFQSRKPEARAFQKWVTSEVLPSIRKQGGYLLIGDNETIEEFDERVADMRATAIKQRMKRLAPAEETVPGYSLAEVAQIIGIEAYELKRQLRECGFIYKLFRPMRLCPPYDEQGLATSHMGEYGEETLFTAKGVDYIIDLYTHNFRPEQKILKGNKFFFGKLGN